MNPKLNNSLSGLLLVSFLALTGLMFYLSQTSHYQTMTLSPTFLQKFGLGWISEAKRLPAPNFSFLDLEGKSHSFNDFRGEGGVLLTFWTTDCPTCRSEIPLLTELDKKWASEGIRVLAINEDPSLSLLRRFQAKERLSYAVGWDSDNSAAIAYGVKGVPTTFAIDPQGRIAYRGFELPTRLEKLIEASVGS